MLTIGSSSALLTAALIMVRQDFAVLAIIILGCLTAAATGWLALRSVLLIRETRQLSRRTGLCADAVAFGRDFDAFDSAAGVLPTLGTVWREYRDLLVRPKPDAARPVVRAKARFDSLIRDAVIHSHLHIPAVQNSAFMIAALGTFTAACAGFAAMVLAAFNLSLRFAGQEIAVQGLIQGNYLFAGLATCFTIAVATFLLVTLLRTGCEMALKSVMASTQELSAQLTRVLPLFVPEEIAFDQYHEMRRQTRHLVQIEKRIQAVENQLTVQAAAGQPSQSGTRASEPARAPVVPKMILPSKGERLRQMSRFADPLASPGREQALTIPSAQTHSGPVASAPPASSTAVAAPIPLSTATMPAEPDRD